MSSLLLDTHVLIWWLDGSDKLSLRVRRLIEKRESRVFVSAVTAWEIAIKHAAGKLHIPNLISDFVGELEKEGFQELPISMQHAVRAGVIESTHKDPFDRMLAAQAQLEQLVLVSKDLAFDQLFVKRYW